MGFALKKGWAPAVLAAVVGIIVYVPPDAVTEILTLAQVLLLTVAILLVLSRITRAAAWPAPRQRLLCWSVAATATVIVCLAPLILSWLRK